MYIFFQNLKLKGISVSSNTSISSNPDQNGISSKIKPSTNLLFVISCIMIILNPMFYTNFYDNQKYQLETNEALCTGVQLSFIFNIMQLLLTIILFTNLLQFSSIKIFIICFFVLTLFIFCVYLFGFKKFLHKGKNLKKNSQKEEQKLKNLEKRNFNLFLYSGQMGVGIFNAFFTIALIFFTTKTISPTNINLIFIIIILVVLVGLFDITIAHVIMKTEPSKHKDPPQKSKKNKQ